MGCACLRVSVWGRLSEGVSVGVLSEGVSVGAV